jgi:hypothetical protein
VDITFAVQAHMLMRTVLDFELPGSDLVRIQNTLHVLSLFRYEF